MPLIDERLAEIRARLDAGIVSQNDMEILLTEVTRLRPIEAAARELADSDPTEQGDIVVVERDYWRSLRRALRKANV